MGTQADPAPDAAAGADDLRSMAESFQRTWKTAEMLAEAFVREAISRGIYRPGDRLPQDSIANILGISRIPVRAGMRQLESEGLLTILPHRGAIVTVLRADDIKEIYELRTLLECDLVERCMPRITPEGLEELRRIAAELDEAAPTTRTIMRRIPFYEHLYSLADRPRALTLVSRLHAEVGAYLVLQSVIEEPFGTHDHLLDFLDSRDVRGAQTWLRKHLSQVSQQLQGIVESVHDVPRS